MAELPYRTLFVAFSLGVSLLHWILDVRQLQALRRPNPPKELGSDSFKDPQLYRKTQAYSLDKWWFNLVQSIYSLAENITVVLVGGLPWAWQLSGRLVSSLPPAVAGVLPLGPGASAMRMELATSVMFMLLVSAFSLVSGLPWSLYSTFVVEARHGFNKTTLALFLRDTLTSCLLGLLILPPVVLAITWILMVAGPLMPLYLWLFVLGFALFFMTIYPTVIQPLFNKFEPLPEGPLKACIEELASSLRFPLRKLYTMDGSKRSSHSNAYMYGFFKNKRIVLFDTLITQRSTEQVVAVLAHELGHWKLRHTPINFLCGQVITLVNFGLLAFIRTQPQLYASFGFHDAQPALLALILFQLLSSPVDEVVNFLMHVVSRRFEYQADHFACSLGHGAHLRSALLVMQEENKGSMQVDPYYSALHYSHPPLVERLRAIDRAMVGLAKKVT